MNPERNMVQTLESIKGGGGSIRVGTTGTISALMTRELNLVKPTSQSPQISSVSPLSGSNATTSANTPRRIQPRKSSDEASTSGTTTNNGMNRRSPEFSRKVKSYVGKSHRMPMIGAENIALERTPSRAKPEKKGPQLVEIVDIKCGNPDKAWATPIAHRLKKLGFSKLSESIM